MGSTWTKHVGILLACAVAAWTLSSGAGSPGPAAGEPQIVFSEEERSRILQHSPLGPPPADPSNAAANEAGAARLGQALFFDKRLSSGTVSCSTCHDPDRDFSDGKPLSEGLRTGRRRTLSLWNVAYNRWFFWDGRRDSLWSQALTPIESDSEMGGTRLGAVRLVASDRALSVLYGEAFGPLPDLSDASRFPPSGRPVPENPDDPRAKAWQGMRLEDRETIDRAFSRIGKAIAAYERRLLSCHSPFDRFVSDLRAERTGDDLSISALRGLKLFVGRGRCRICHSGANFTDGEFHNTGVPPLAGDRPPDDGRFGGIDLLLGDPFNLSGRFADGGGEAAEKIRALRKLPETWGQFKTPSLRNVAKRGPYMHQGQLAKLRDVLRFYSTREGALAAGPDQEKVLVPLRLTAEETDDLLAFLDSLTDEGIDPALRAPPRPPMASPTSSASH